MKSFFNKLVDIIWPIHRHELKRFLSLTLLVFCILFIQNIARALKDGIITTMIGPETISFLKFWGVLPTAVGASILYIKMINSLQPQYIFYLVLSFFVAFFILFAFVLFPNYQNLHISDIKISKIILSYPHLKWFILITAKWSFSLYYIIIDLWTNLVYTLLFWQFVNCITSIEQSKRFYILFALLGQTGLYISGYLLENISKIIDYILENIFSNVVRDVLFVQIILSLCIFFGIIIFFAFWLLNNKILTNDDKAKIKFKKKKKIGFFESMQLVFKSKYLCLIAGILFCYGLTVAVAEGSWKAQVSKVYSTAEEYTSFVGTYLKYNGIITIIFVILGSNIIRKVGWLTAAMITPTIIFCFGVLFFLSLNYNFIPYILHLDPVFVTVLIGAAQNVMTKSSKYTLLDSTKEMSYVPLEDELKTTGKAANDVLGTKLGKSTGSFLQSLMFIIMPTATYYSISLYLMFLFIIICIIWFVIVKLLSVEYYALIDKTN